MKEIYTITRTCNITYNEVMHMSVIERDELLRNISEERRNNDELWKKAKAESKKKSANKR